jgi:hypothetical protein
VVPRHATKCSHDPRRDAFQRHIIDIGPDFARRAAGRDPSPFYNMERQLTDGYPNYTSVSTRSVNLKEVCRVLTTERGVNQSEVETRAAEAFGFLRKSPTVASRLEREGGRSLLTYLLPEVFVEIELDWRELAVFVLVGEPVEGKLPGGYYVDGRGRKVRWHVAAALEEGGYAESARRLKRLARSRARKQCWIR